MPTIQQAKDWYPQDDPVHGFDHVLRVYALAEALAQAEGADLEIVRSAALLHDAQPPEQEDGLSGEVRRSNHHHASAAFAVEVLRREDWPADRIAAVEHCIRSHRFRDASQPPETLEARVLFDADKLDAIGATGVARAVAYAARHDLPAYAPPSAQFLERGQIVPGEPYSAYHEYCFKLSKLKDRLFTPTARVWGEQRHLLMATFFAALAAEASGASGFEKNT